MIDIVHYVTFDLASQTLRYEPPNFGQLNFHTKILRVWKDSKLQEWLQNRSFSLINMWSAYWLS